MFDRVPEPLNQVEIGAVKMAAIIFTIGCQNFFHVVWSAEDPGCFFSGSLSSCLPVSQEELKKLKTLT